MQIPRLQITKFQQKSAVCSLKVLERILRSSVMLTSMCVEFSLKMPKMFLLTVKEDAAPPVRAKEEPSSRQKSWHRAVLLVAIILVVAVAVGLTVALMLSCGSGFSFVGSRRDPKLNNLKWDSTHVATGAQAKDLTSHVISTRTPVELC